MGGPISLLIFTCQIVVPVRLVLVSQIVIAVRNFLVREVDTVQKNLREVGFDIFIWNPNPFKSGKGNVGSLSTFIQPRRAKRCIQLPTSPDGFEFASAELSSYKGLDTRSPSPSSTCFPAGCVWRTNRKPAVDHLPLSTRWRIDHEACIKTSAAHWFRLFP